MVFFLVRTPFLLVNLIINRFPVKTGASAGVSITGVGVGVSVGVSAGVSIYPFVFLRVRSHFLKILVLTPSFIIRLLAVVCSLAVSGLPLLWRQIQSSFVFYLLCEIFSLRLYTITTQSFILLYN
jgi:hypothetical protein